MRAQVGEYFLYTLDNGDMSVTRGAWILARYYKATDEIVVVDWQAPPFWLDDARKLLSQKLIEQTPAPRCLVCGEPGFHRACQAEANRQARDDERN